jgi:NADP-dependent 3-hydroxy acid dehydrogenase YdfG
MSVYASALVTGAGRGIGAATVCAFRAAGMEVHAVARSADALRGLASETGCIPHVLDVTDQEAVASVFQDLPLDVLVNNAGTASPDGPIYQQDPGEISRVFNVNVSGITNMLSALVPGMRARDRGHIVNITSIAAHHALPGQPAYSASKTAVRSLTQGLRLDLFGTRIRVTEIAPARVETYFHAQQFSGDREATKHALYDGYESLKPEDIADAIAYCVGAPEHVDVTLMEMLPTLQVIGGIDFHRSGD